MEGGCWDMGLTMGCGLRSLIGHMERTWRGGACFGGMVSLLVCD